MSNAGARKHVTRKPYFAGARRLRTPSGIREMIAELERTGYIRRVASRGLVCERLAIDARLAAVVESGCISAPDLAFDTAVDVLSDTAKTATALADEGVIAIAAIQAQGERIERLNEDTKRLLSELVAG